MKIVEGEANLRPTGRPGNASDTTLTPFMDLRTALSAAADALDVVRDLSNRFARELLDTKDARAADVAKILDLHTPMTEEVDRYPDDDLSPPVDEPVLLFVEVCSECGYTYDDETVVYRPWPCPTVRVLKEKR